MKAISVNVKQSATVKVLLTTRQLKKQAMTHFTDILKIWLISLGFYIACKDSHRFVIIKVNFQPKVHKIYKCTYAYWNQLAVVHSLDADIEVASLYRTSCTFADNIFPVNVEQQQVKHCFFFSKKGIFKAYFLCQKRLQRLWVNWRTLNFLIIRLNADFIINRLLDKWQYVRITALSAVITACLNILKENHKTDDCSRK